MIDKEEEYLKSNFSYIKRSKYLRMRIFSIIMFVMILLLGAFSYKLYFVDSNETDRIVQLNDLYSKKNYKKIVQMYDNMSINEMTPSERYQVAYSSIYADTDNLSNEEKAALISEISYNTDTRYLEYWIVFGRDDFEKAVDIAKTIQEDDLALLALVARKQSVLYDNTIPGVKKEQIISELDKEIEEYNLKLNPPADPIPPQDIGGTPNG